MSNAPISHIDWVLVDDFDSTSQHYHCSMTGFPKRTGEPGVWRGAMIDYEGFFTISQMSAEQLATALGWLPPGVIDEQVSQIVELQDAIEALNEKLAAAENLLSAYERADEAGL